MNAPRQYRSIRRIAVALGLIGLVVIFLPKLACFYKTALTFYYLADLDYHQKTFQRAWSNDRRDRVEVVTEWIPPFLSTFTFKPGNSETETTLLTVNSKTIWVNVKWRGEDHVDVSITLDPDAKIEKRIDAVGNVQVTYSFVYKNKTMPLPPGWDNMGRRFLF